MTCHQIWHYRWANGAKRPSPRLGRDIQLRATGQPQRARRTSASGCATRDRNARASSVDAGSDPESVQQIDADADSDEGAYSSAGCGDEVCSNAGVDEVYISAVV